MKVLLRPSTGDMEIVWVNSEALDRHWSNDDSYVSEYGAEPRSTWFVRRETKEGLILPEVILHTTGDSMSASISANRHRTRWLISDKGLKEILVGMWEGDIEKGIELGLVARRVQDDEQIELPVEI